MQRAVALTIRLYRALLVLYPGPFRRAYGPLLVTACEQMCEEAMAQGGIRALLRLWRRVAMDLISSVPRQHLEQKGKWIMSRDLWLLWILASIGGWLAAAWLLPLRFPPLALPAGGALVSALHVILLQRYRAPAGWWRRALPLAAGSWFLPLLLFVAVPWGQLSGTPFIAVYAALLLLSAALVGALQALALRPLLHSPWRWALAPAAGLVAGAAIIMVASITLIPLAVNLAARGTLSTVLPAGFIPPTVAANLGPLLPLLNIFTAVIATTAYGMITAFIFLSATNHRLITANHTQLQ